MFRYVSVLIIWFVSLSSALADSKRVAVLQFQGIGIEREVLHKLSDQSRLAALEVLSSAEYDIMTRENMVQILSDMGKDISECIGACEVEVGRNLGADWIVTGDILKIDGVYHLTLKLHETKGGMLVAGQDIAERRFSDLKDETFEQSKDLFKEALRAETKVIVAQKTEALQQTEYNVVLIPAGSFMMGCTEEQVACSPDEKPTFRVTISRDFYMMEERVTQALYEKVMKESPSYYAGLDRWVDSVSWYDAIKFANALSEKEGLEPCYAVFGRRVRWKDKDCNGWRLPTEAEWEFAARGAAAATQLMSAKNSSYPAGTSISIALGAREWCWDRYGLYSALSKQDPAGVKIGFLRAVRVEVMRGEIRVSGRSGLKPNYSNRLIGFRLVRNP